MGKYETTPGVLNIAETCAASLSIDELVSLSSADNTSSPLSTSLKLTYGPVTGSPALRGRIASLCGTKPGETSCSVAPDDVIVTSGAISANFLVLYSLVGPRDHVICVYPTYQQLFAVPESLGAEVSLWKLKEENGYVPDPTELEGLVRPNTKVGLEVKQLFRS